MMSNNTELAKRLRAATAFYWATRPDEMYELNEEAAAALDEADTEIWARSNFDLAVRVCDTATKLEAENTRLREALEDLVTAVDDKAVSFHSPMIGDGGVEWYWHEEWLDKARAALTPPKEPRKDPSP